MIESIRSQMAAALVATLCLGAFSTAADWVWSRYLTDGALLPALVHGVLVFLLLALLLGRASPAPGATRRLLLSLPVAGFAIAALFYPLARVVGYLAALLATWIAMWMSLALVQRWALRAAEPGARAVARGVCAALGSGLAFWAVSGMWTDPAFAGGYLVRLLYWSCAFLPGFLALLLRRDAR